MTSASDVRVRFAPSPTGRLHIGGARTALFNWAFARRNGGVFVLRVEDTDRERNTEEALDSILASLRWLGLEWDEGPEKGGAAGPYFQSQRDEKYRAAAERLLAEGHAYRCFCSPERVAQLKEEQRAAKRDPRYDGRCRGIAAEESARRAEAGEAFTIRHAVEPGREILIPDMIRGEVRFQGEQVEDWVMVRSGGYPTYNFACVVDDADMAISHVLRGEEHLVNTPKQVLLYQDLGLEEPCYAHLPLILGEDGKKLSKRTGDTAVEDYREKGYPADALFNFLSRLGLSLDDKTEVFTREELVQAFDMKRVNKSGAIFDLDKLHWLCGEYLRATPDAELAAAALPWYRAAGLVSEDPDAAMLEWLARVVGAHKERVRLYSELPEASAYLFQDELTPDAKAAKALEDDGAAERLAEIAADLEGAEPFPPADFDVWVKARAEERGIKPVAYLKPMRAALAGKLGGPGVGEILSLLGRERSLRRLRAPESAGRA